MTHDLSDREAYLGYLDAALSLTQRALEIAKRKGFRTDCLQQSENYLQGCIQNVLFEDRGAAEKAGKKP